MDTMLHIIEVTDLSVPEPDVFARLTEAQLCSRCTPERALFIVEGLKVIGHTPDAGYEPVSLLTGHRQLEGPARDILTRCGDVFLYTAGRDTLVALTGYELTRGALRVTCCPSLLAVEELRVGARWVAVLEGTVDPTNVGAIFRSTVALHMDGVLVTPTCCGPLHRRAVWVSAGTVFQIPWTYIGARSADWSQPGLVRLWALGLQTVAMALSLEAFPIEDSRLVSAEKPATVLGTEGGGLPPRTVIHCDYIVCIPMAHGADSLNMATASAMAFW